MSISYGYNYGGTSASTSTGTYWTNSSIEETTRRIATIRDTKSPHSKWTDVISVSIDGAKYKLEDLVIIRNSKGALGRIIEFEPTLVTMRIVGSMTDEYLKCVYDNIRHVGSKEVGSVKLDPNTAFKLKKKGRY